jgi:hypothetical protein
MFKNKVERKMFWGEVKQIEQNIIMTKSSQVVTAVSINCPRKDLYRRVSNAIHV